MEENLAFLLGVILGVAGVFGYQLTKRSKRAFFKKQLKLAEQDIWQQEFTKFSTMLAYEQQRQLLSKGEDHLAQLKSQKIEGEKNEELDGKIKEVEDRLASLKALLDEYDQILNGQEKSEKYPNGLRGINEQLEGTAQKKKNIEDFIKYNC